MNNDDKLLRSVIREAINEEDGTMTIEFNGGDIVDAMMPIARRELGLDEHAYYQARYSFSADEMGRISLKLIFSPMKNVVPLRQKPR